MYKYICASCGEEFHFAFCNHHSDREIPYPIICPFCASLEHEADQKRFYANYFWFMLACGATLWVAYAIYNWYYVLKITRS